MIEGHFTHETEGPWRLHFKHSHWWKRWSRSRFASHYAWGTTGVRECKKDVKFTWILTWHRLDHVSWSLGLFTQNHLLDIGLTQIRETMVLQNFTTIDLLYFIMCKDHTWIEIHWHNIWLRVWPHMISHYTWGFVITLHDFGSVLGWPLDTSFGLSQFHNGVTTVGSCVKRLSKITQCGHGSSSVVWSHMWRDPST